LDTRGYIYAYEIIKTQKNNIFANNSLQIIVVCSPVIHLVARSSLYFDIVDTMMVSSENLPSESCIEASSCSNLVEKILTFELLFNY